MNVKSIATKAMVAAALAVTTVAPAFANNNNQALNMMAMQMYAQNQANAYNGAYANPYALGGVYGQPGTIPGAPLYGRQSVGYGAYAGYNNNYGRNFGLNRYGWGGNRGIFNRRWHR